MCSSDLMTKPVTCLAVLMLFEEGHFLLTDPVSKYIPEFENMTVLVPGADKGQIGRASCRERVEISVVAGALKKKREEKIREE